MIYGWYLIILKCVFIHKGPPGPPGNTRPGPPGNQLIP